MLYRGKSITFGTVYECTHADKYVGYLHYQVSLTVRPNSNDVSKINVTEATDASQRSPKKEEMVAIHKKNTINLGKTARKKKFLKISLRFTIELVPLH